MTFLWLHIGQCKCNESCLDSGWLLRYFWAVNKNLRDTLWTWKILQSKPFIKIWLWWLVQGCLQVFMLLKMTFKIITLKVRGCFSNHWWNTPSFSPLLWGLFGEYKFKSTLECHVLLNNYADQRTPLETKSNWNECNSNAILT